MKPAVDFNNRAEVAEWLNSLIERAYELGDIAAEATAKRGARKLTKAALRRELAETFADLHRLCRAGRRGIRAPKGKP